MAVLLMLGRSAHAAGDRATVRGKVTADTTWTGTIDVAGDLLVHPNVTLTINDATVRVGPGVEVRVEGAIRASKSHFVSASEKPAPGDWKGIVIEAPAFEFEPPAPPRSSLTDCTIEHAYTGVRIRGHNLAASPEIVGCTVARCRWGGIVVEGVKKPRLERNSILEICLGHPSDQGRPLALMDCSEATILGNEVVNCSDMAIFLNRCSRCEIKDNKTKSITGGPGPGPGGYYKQWAYALMLLDSDDNHIAGNSFLDTAYTTLSLAYGSDRNLVEHNRCETTLDSLNVLGNSVDNVFRDNQVAGGWSCLYVTGDVPVRYEKCDADGAFNGACFTARTGRPAFVDCTWNKTVGMNIWGNSRVIVDHCRLRDAQQYSVSLQDAAVGTLIDCEFDENAMKSSDGATGRIEVKNRLSISAVDDANGMPIKGFRVIAKPADGSKPVWFSSADGKPAADALTKFVFTAKGRQPAGPWTIRVESDNYQPFEFVLPMDSAVQRSVRLKK
jgi:parallel beta-helix repeat protein